MMKFIFTGMIVVSVVFALFSGHMTEVSNAALSEGISAVKLILTLAGGMCLWSGVMKVAEESGLAAKIARLWSPVTSRLLGLSKDNKALNAVSMNITANMLGLGNAATPLGIKAMEELQKEGGTSGRATKAMCVFVVLNCASVQLLPTTVATLRLAHGAGNPLDILPATLATSFFAAAVGLILIKIFARDKR